MYIFFARIELCFLVDDIFNVHHIKLGEVLLCLQKTCSPYSLRHISPPEGATVMEQQAETSPSQYKPPCITEMLSVTAAVVPLVKELGIR